MNIFRIANDNVEMSFFTQKISHTVRNMDFFEEKCYSLQLTEMNYTHEINILLLF